MEVNKVNSNTFEELYCEYEKNYRYDSMNENVALALTMCLEIRKLNINLSIISQEITDSLDNIGRGC